MLVPTLTVGTGLVVETNETGAIEISISDEYTPDFVSNLEDLLDVPSPGDEFNTVLTYVGVYNNEAVYSWTLKPQAISIGTGTDILRSSMANSPDGNSHEIRSVALADTSADPRYCISAGITSNNDELQFIFEGFLGNNGRSSLADVDVSDGVGDWQVLAWNPTLGKWYPTNVGSVENAGEVNLAENVGNGDAGIFRDKTNVTLNFRSLLGGSGITVEQVEDVIVISNDDSIDNHLSEVTYDNNTNDLVFSIEGDDGPSVITTNIADNFLRIESPEPGSWETASYVGTDDEGRLILRLVQWDGREHDISLESITDLISDSSECCDQLMALLNEETNIRQTAIQSMNTDIVNAVTRMDSVEAVVATTQTSVTDVSSRLVNAETVVSGFEARVASAETAVATAASERLTLSSDIAAAVTDIKSAANLANTINTKVSVLEADKVTIADVNNSLSGYISSSQLVTELDTFKSTVDANTATIVNDNLSNYVTAGSLTTEMNNLKATVTTDLNANIATEINSVKAIVASDLQAEITAVTAARAADLNTLKATVDSDLQTQVATIGAARTTELNALKATIDSDLQAERAVIATARTADLNALKATVDSNLQTEIATVNSARTSDLNALKATIDSDLQAEKAIITAARTTELNNLKATLETDIDSQYVKNDSLTTELNALKSTLQSDTNGKIADLNISSIQASITSLNTKDTSKDSTIAALEATVASLTTELNSVKTDVTAVVTDVAAVQTEVTGVKSSVTSQAAKLDTVESGLASANSKAVQHDELLNKFGVDIEDLKR